MEDNDEEDDEEVHDEEDDEEVTAVREWYLKITSSVQIRWCWDQGDFMPHHALSPPSDDM